MFQKRQFELCDHLVAVPAKYTGGTIIQHPSKFMSRIALSDPTPPRILSTIKSENAG